MPLAVRESIRDDGLRVITRKLSYTKKVMISIECMTGSAYDPKKHSGLAHFSEHMAFKGTKKHSMYELLEISGKYFLKRNACTGHTFTSYFCEAVYNRTNQMIDYLADIYFNSVFPEEEIKKEKETISNELAFWEDDDDKKVFVELWKLLWKLNPMRKHGGGTYESIKKMHQNLFLRYQKEWHIPSNTAIIGVGNLDHDYLRDKIFEIFPKSNKKLEYVVWDDEVDVLPFPTLSVVGRKEREKATVLYGCKAPVLNERDFEIMNILKRIFFQGDDSILRKEVRSKRGWAYRTGGGLSGIYSLGHYFYWVSQVFPKRVEKVQTLMKNIPCYHEIHSEDFENQKQFLIEKRLVGLEDLYDWVDEIRHRILYEGQPVSIFNGYTRKKIDLISSISLSEVLEMREKLFKPERLAHVLIMPV